MDPLLDPLYAELTTRGLPTGPEERLRVGIVVRAHGGVAPGNEDDSEGLRLALAAVLVKDPAQREACDQAVRAWLARNAPTLPSPAGAPLPWRPESPGQQATRDVAGAARRWGLALRRHRRVAGALLFLVVVVAAWGLWPDPVPVTASNEDSAAPVIDTDVPVAAPVAQEGEVLVDTPVFHPGPPWTPPWAWGTLGAALAALLGALIGTIVLVRRRERPESAPVVPAPPRPPRPSAAAPLLDPDDQDRLASGVARQRAEAPSTVLDLVATVRATAAAAGIPSLRYEPGTTFRGVGVWIDRADVPDEALRFARDVEAVLEEAGIPVRTGDLYGDDPVLWSTTGPTPLHDIDLDERRAPVLFVTGGRVLSVAIDEDPERARVGPLLDELATFDALLVVEFGDPPLLAARLAPWGIAVAGPAQALDRLSGEGRARPPRSADLRMWEAACAFSPTPVTADDALRLRRALALEVDTWWLPTLGDGRFPLRPGPRERADRLGWLESALGYGRHRRDDGALPPALVRILDASRRLGAADPLPRALLDLWDRPAEAIPALQALGRARVGAAVAFLIPADAAVTDDRAVGLPWALPDLPSGELVPLLVEIGFGAAVGWAPRSVIRTPARRWVGGGMLAGVAVAASLAAWWMAPVVPGPRVDPPPSNRDRYVACDATTCFAAGLTATAVQPAQPGEVWNVTWEPRSLPCREEVDGVVTLRCPSGGGLIYADSAIAGLKNAAQHVAIEARGDGAEALGRHLMQSGSAIEVRLGTATAHSPLPTLAGGWDHHDLMIPEEVDLAALTTTARNLPLGGVLASTVEGWKVLPGADHFTLAGGSRWCGDGFCDAIEHDLSREEGWCFPDCGARPSAPNTPACGNGIVEAGEECDDPRGNSPLPDRCHSNCRSPRCGDGLPDRTDNCATGGCPADCAKFMPTPSTFPVTPSDTPALSWTKLTWVKLFTGKEHANVIGSSGKGTDETPQWTVTLDYPLEMLATEVTNAQYRGETGTAEDMLPVAEVTWAEARTWCQNQGGRLPTEVEWEYAARAGTKTDWSFEGGESRLGEYAWYIINSDGHSHPVATRRKNPWELYDMYGNLWEWVEDTYDNNAWGPFAPSAFSSLSTVNKTGSGRVVRGGSFYYKAEFTRSAFRYWSSSGGGDALRGFRCVRGTLPER